MKSRRRVPACPDTKTPKIYKPAAGYRGKRVIMSGSRDVTCVISSHQLVGYRLGVSERERARAWVDLHAATAGPGRQRDLEHGLVQNPVFTVVVYDVTQSVLSRAEPCRAAPPPPTPPENAPPISAPLRSVPNRAYYVVCIRTYLRLYCSPTQCPVAC
ncbi:hypothetical protein J6590_041255 [Homalodisca vitripennis]|nr:hypothetical protein J6590_041255 [Homalodisca vitripennis]